MSFILTLNSGSSSIKLAVHALDATLSRVLSGSISRIGVPGTIFKTCNHRTHATDQQPLNSDMHSVLQALRDWLTQHVEMAQLAAITHRIVYGMEHTQPALLSSELLSELIQTADHDPEHMPHAIALVRAMQAHAPHTPQVACFDTAFHHTLPTVTKLLPIPRHLQQQGLRRYGFHGLSYAYLLQTLQQDYPEVAQGRVILAHLGNGASMAALHHGQCRDTSMGFTPCGGLVMGTRSGDLDPGVITHLLRHENLTPMRLDHLLNHESGLLGISGTHADMHDLLAREASDEHAAQAIELFCYQARKQIGAYAAALGGLDALVFSGGIGEHAAVIRERICAPLGFLGVELDGACNVSHARCISSSSSRVMVLMIPTDEEHMMAQQTCELLNLRTRNEARR